MTLNRRMFVGPSAFAAPMVLAQGRPHVAVVSGGVMTAHFIAKDSKGDIHVILIEPTRTYYTCFLSTSATVMAVRLPTA